jgi:hypothetical protein
MSSSTSPQTSHSISQSLDRIRRLDSLTRLLQLPNLTKLRNLQAHHHPNPAQQRRIGPNRVRSLLGHSPRTRPTALQPLLLPRLSATHERALPHSLPHVPQAPVQLTRPRNFHNNKSERDLRSSQRDPPSSDMHARSPIGAVIQRRLFARLFVRDRSLSLAHPRARPGVWRELVARRRDDDKRLDDDVAATGGLGACDGRGFALSDVVDV